jgi:hypothetical protein
MSARPVPSWQARNVGDFPAALRRRRQRMRSNDANGRYRTGVRKVTNKAEVAEIMRAGVAESALGRGPNPRLQRTRPLLRFRMTLKGSSWGPCR